MNPIHDSHRPAGAQRSCGSGHFNWWRRGLGLGLVACAVAVAGCGGGSHGSAGQTTTAGLASASHEKALPAGKPARKLQSKPIAGQRAAAPSNPKHGGGAHRDSSSPTIPKAASKASPQPSAKAGKKAGGKKSQAKSPHSSVKPNGTEKPAHLPPPPSSSASALPPGMSVYSAARQVCSDPNALEVLPPKSRNDAELIAGMVEGFAPAGHEQEAHDGCLVGLHDQGIG